MILIISKNKKHSAPISEMFYFMGVLSYAATPTEALSLISPIFNCVLIVNPDMLADKADYVARLRSYLNISIFALNETANEIDSIIFDGVIKRSTHAPKILSLITNFADNGNMKIPGTYRLAGIDASIHLRAPMYFDKIIPLTKTETMILRSLICAYPTPLSAKEILKYAFRQSRLPERSSVRTHISIMNKKFRGITGRFLTALTPGEGYRVLTPEIAEAINA